ncbi:cyclase family protein [Aeromicrobium sp. UC242_57]|uniref:cyclase family protein n=1 Tax=Aeromicrobium sp. UC242_57 TaxID=3374624 RepID=UPI003793D957
MTVDGGDGKSLVEFAGSASSNRRWQEGAMMVGSDLMRYNDDMVVMHLQSATQWDALAHVYYEDKLYNGYPASSVTSFGASKRSIDKVDVKGITSRAVLLDMVKYRGEEMHCAHGEHIMPDELTEAAKQQGVEVGEGDIVLVHTGWTTKFYATGDKSPSAGLNWRCAEWLHERGVAAVAGDNSQVEDPVSELEGNLLPMHLLCLRDMGMQFGEYWKPMPLPPTVLRMDAMSSSSLHRPCASLVLWARRSTRSRSSELPDRGGVAQGCDRHRCGIWHRPGHGQPLGCGRVASGARRSRCGQDP